MSDTAARLGEALADRYRVGRELGAGGMATVYLAHDLRHERDVAIKVLHPDLGAALGPERFLAEIRTTAKLQHPHILPLLDSGAAGGLLFYVMPFVDGETLRARLEREGPLPIDDALRVTGEVLGALDYAHRRGVVHRDVKPENVLLNDGSALVADFGIALAVQTAGGARMTQTGLSLGTPSYMSPEQAMGERGVDGRSDIYAAGAMLYEMLTGEPPFTGPSVQAIVAKLMTERPTPPSTVRETVPPGVEAAVMKALARLPADRFATAGEFAAALQRRLDAPSGTAALAGGAPHAPAAARRRHGVARALAWSPWALAALLAAALGAAVRRPAPAERPVVRAHLDLPAGEQVMVSGFPLVLSPTGDRIAYVTSSVQGYRTFVRRSDELVGRQVAPVSLRAMAFSPDGRWLVHAQGREVRKMPADGGAALPLGSLPAEVVGLCWTARGEIVLATTAGLWVMPAAGGAPRRLTSGAARPMGQPVAPGDGRTVIFANEVGTANRDELAVVSLEGGAPEPLGIRGAAPLGMVDDHLLYVTSAGVLMAVPFDVSRRRATGDPVQVERGVNGAGLSASGTLAYLPGESRSVMVRASRARDDEPLLPEARSYNAPRFSPDGRRVALAVVDSTGDFTRGDIWVYDVGPRTLTRLTTDGVNGAPEWSPDGGRILYRTVRDGKFSIRWQRADGGTPPELLYAPPMATNEALLSPDGRWLVYRTAPSTAAPRSIFAVPLSGGPPVLLVGGAASHTMPRLSPDGRWLAYQSDESGRFEVYVRPFPGDGPRVQVSRDGGSESIWSRAGGTLYYRTARGLVAASVTLSPGFAVRDQRTVLAGEYVDDPTHQSYDVSPDDESFLMLRPESGRRQAVIVHDWVRELRARLAREPGR